MAALPERLVLHPAGSSNTCPALPRRPLAIIVRRRPSRKLLITEAASDSRRRGMAGADRSQRERALLDNGEEEEDIDPSNNGRFGSQSPFAAERDPYPAETRRTGSSSNGAQQPSSQQPQHVRQQGVTPHSPVTIGRQENESEVAQQLLDSSATQRIRSSASRQSDANSSTFGAANGTAPASQADAWGDWGSAGSNIGSEPQQQRQKGGNAFAWTQRDHNSSRDGNSSPKDEEARTQGDEDDDQPDERYKGERYREGDDARVGPDITPLTASEQEKMIRLAPSGEQAAYFNSTTVDFVQQWVGASIVTLLAATKLVWVAAGSLTFPFWWPWAQAALKNQALLSKYRHQGLWRARVIGVELQGKRNPQFTDTGKGQRTPLRPRYDPLLCLGVGDDSGARSEITVPFLKGYENIRVGDTVELVVVSTSQNFDDFVALQEAYLPMTSMWLAKYPFLNRDVFLDLSLAIERQRTAIQPIDITAEAYDAPFTAASQYYD